MVVVVTQKPYLFLPVLLLLLLVLLLLFLLLPSPPSLITDRKWRRRVKHLLSGVLRAPNT